MEGSTQLAALRSVTEAMLRDGNFAGWATSSECLPIESSPPSISGVAAWVARGLKVDKQVPQLPHQSHIE